MDQSILQFLTPPKKERLSNKIASQIKTLIFSENIEVGDKLPPERELADLMGVSRAVVGEALRSLEQSGLIEIKQGPSGGAFVTYNLYKPFLDSIYDLFREGKLTLHHFYEARRAIECASVRLAVENVSPNDIRRLEKINQKLLDDIDDNTRLRENNMAFHMGIADISGNPLITIMIQSLIELLNTLYPQSMQASAFIKDTYKRHEAIINAMKDKDVKLCEELMSIDTEHTKKLRSNSSI
jgi:GntR family transcriptional repressor for pyruvate dehydrogenase complex